MNSSQGSALPKSRSSETTVKLLRFLLAGLPGFLVAVSLNLFLLKVLDWPGPIAYAAVLLVQVTVNFLFCIYFVFERNTEKSIARQFFAFLSGILMARVFDWALYVALTELLGIPYLVAQLSNILVFSIAKFAFARRVIEGR